MRPSYPENSCHASPASSATVGSAGTDRCPHAAQNAPLSAAPQFRQLSAACASSGLTSPSATPPSRIPLPPSDNATRNLCRRHTDAGRLPCAWPAPELGLGSVEVRVVRENHVRAGGLRQRAEALRRDRKSVV